MRWSWAFSGYDFWSDVGFKRIIQLCLRIGPRGTGAKAGRLLGGSALLQVRGIPFVVRIFRTPKAARMSSGPERAALLVCRFQAQNINISLALERELARASLGPSSCPSSFPRALTIEHHRAQTPAKPHNI